MEIDPLDAGHEIGDRAYRPHVLFHVLSHLVGPISINLSVGVEEDEDFTPFAPREAEPRKSRGRFLIVAIIVLLIAAIVAGVWFLAPLELRQRLGIADASDTPLQLMMTHSDRTQLASGNEFLNISGRIINPTDQQQKVPPIYAQLHDASGKVVYKWTIPPPMKTIPPGGSASFNSAELNIPPAAQELTVTLGEPKI